MHYSLTLSKGSCVGRGERAREKKHEPMVESCCYSRILIEFIWGREDEDKKRQKNDQKCFFVFLFFNFAFLGIYLKQSTYSFFGAWSLCLVHI